MVPQEDNDPKHRSRACAEYNRENGNTTMNCFSQSPEAYPIENVWSVMKMKLMENDMYNLKQLIGIREVWRGLPLELPENLVESMPR